MGNFQLELFSQVAEAVIIVGLIVYLLTAALFPSDVAEPDDDDVRIDF